MAAVHSDVANLAVGFASIIVTSSPFQLRSLVAFSSHGLSHSDVLLMQA